MQKAGDGTVGTQAADKVWRWRDAGLASLIWYVPVTGLLNDTATMTVNRALSSILVGLLVGAIMSVPLSSIHSQVTKTASARRVAEAVWTAAAVAAALVLLGVDHRSLVAVVISLALLWLALAVSVAVRPLSAARTNPVVAVSWLPVPHRSPVATAGKRFFDAVVSAAALVVIAPLLAIVAIAIKANDGGPILFKQRRVGRDGVPFEMLKFRSMVNNAEDLRAELEASSERSGPLFKMTNDPRITPIGRIIRELSIDELPQLLNILRGDMSLVGPRPALPEEAELFDSTLQRRSAVTPGLTGLWQAEARSDGDFERFRDLDLRYVSAASPALDLWIILATATDVIVAAASVPLNAAGFDIKRADGVDAQPDATVDARPANTPGTRPSAA